MMCFFRVDASFLIEADEHHEACAEWEDVIVAAQANEAVLFLTSCLTEVEDAEMRALRAEGPSRR